MYICRNMYMFIIEYIFINLIFKYFVLNFIIIILSIFVLFLLDIENKVYRGLV